MSNTKTTQALRFGEYSVRPASRMLFKNGTRVRLYSQSFEILLMLLNRPGEVVTRNELKQKLWPSDTFVDFEHGVNAAIRNLRRTLNDSADKPRYIETIPRLGYRFIAEVSLTTDETKECRAGEPGIPISGEDPRIPASVPASAIPFTFAGSWWRLLLAALALCAAFALFAYPRRPFAPLPHVIRIHQVTDIGSVVDNQHLLLSGSRIYFAVGEGGGFQIKFVDLDQGGVSTVPGPSPQVELCDISPSGNELLINRFEAGFPPMNWRRSLWRLPLSSGNPQRIEGVFADDSAWSPDGRTIVLTHEVEQSLYLVGTDGTNFRKLTSVPGTPFKPRWSPDGRVIRLSVSDPKENKTSLWQFDLANNRLTPMLPRFDGPNRLVAGNWTLDGRYFFFSASQGGPRNLWVLQDETDLLHRRTELPLQLTNGPLSFSLPTPSRDGKTIYAVGVQTRGQLMAYDLKSGKFAPYFDGLSADQFSFSKDGKWMAYVSYPDGMLVTSRLDGSQRLQLTFPPMRVVTPRWSPDGSKIVFAASATPAKPFKVYVIPSRGGSPQLLAPQIGWEQLGPDWLQKGESVLFTSLDESGGFCVMHEWDLKTGKDTVLPESIGLGSASVSPDGRIIAAVTIHAEGLVLYDIASHAKRFLAQVAVFPSWSADGKYVYYSTLMKGPILGTNETAVYRVHADDGKIERLAPPPDFRLTGNWGFWSGPAPDGSPLVLRELGTSDIYALNLDTP